LLYNNVPVPLCNGQEEACEYEEFVKFARNAVGNHTHKSYKETCGVVDKLKLKKEKEKNFLERDEDQEEEEEGEIEKSPEKILIESLIAGPAGERELLISSTPVSLNLNSPKKDYNFKGKYSNLIIIFGWAVLSIIVCILIKSRTKSMRLHKFTGRQGKKRISNSYGAVNSEDLEIKIQ